MGAVAKALSRAQARKLTDAVRDAAEETWRLLSLAYDQRAWEPLGYKTWAAYVTDEFGMTDRNARLLLDQAHVIGALESAAGRALPAGTVSGRAAQDLKPTLEDTASAVADAVAGVGEAEAVAAAAEVIARAAEEERERKRLLAERAAQEAAERKRASELLAAEEDQKRKRASAKGKQLSLFEERDTRPVVPARLPTREEATAAKALARRLLDWAASASHAAIRSSVETVPCTHRKPMWKQLPYGTICDPQAGGCGAKVR